MTKIIRADCEALDRGDSLACFQDRFESPQEGRLYFDGNSVGPMPKAARIKLERLLDRGWRDARSQGWFREGWLEQARYLGRNIAHLIGAGPDDVVFCDNTSINLFKVLISALRLRPERKRILTERGNFSTDLYIAEGVCRLLGDDRLGDCHLGDCHQIHYTADGEELLDVIDERVAVVYLSLVNYRDSRRHDLTAITRAAQARGALVIWDLSHAAGAIEIRLLDAGVDFAVGCGYKYLCGGPGAPSFIFVHPRHQQDFSSAIPGWMGHRDMLAFTADYQPAAGVQRLLTGTPSVLANTAAEAAMELWAEVDAELLFAKHRQLSELLVQLLDQELDPLGVELRSPKQYQQRGGHVAFAVPDGQKVVDQLRDHGVCCSFRKPGLIRFGLHPLALRFVDIWDGIAAVKETLHDRT